MKKAADGTVISRLERDILTIAPEPERGLGEELFLLVSKLTPMVNVDLLIKDKYGKTLLVWREDRYYPAGWHVPGGIVRFQEHWSERVHQVASSELGMKVAFNPKPIAINEVIRPGIAERGHFVSLLFECQPQSEPSPELAQSREKPVHGQWRWHARLPDDMISVQKMYEAYF
jgi:ADP-ribose pyrophosphatase YjhB (NUDIX family)